MQFKIANRTWYKSIWMGLGIVAMGLGGGSWGGGGSGGFITLVGTPW